MAVLSAGFVSVAFGQNDCNGASPTCFGINGYQGSFTSPYTGGVYVPGELAPPSIQIICDDYADHISGDQQWNVLVTDLSAFGNQGSVFATQTNTVSSVYYGGGDALPGTYTQTQEYVAAASLAIQIDSLPFPFTSPNSEPQRDDLSAALWAIFQPSQIGALDAGAQADLNAALTLATNPSNASGASFESNSGYDVTIYTPTLDGSTPNPNTYNHAGSDNAPQEFITLTYVPEPSMAAILGFDLAGAGLAGLYFIRRKSRSRL